MKKTASLLVLIFCGFVCGYGQDDDIYFVPSKKETPVKDIVYSRPEAAPVDEREEPANWAEGRGNGGWDVDAYNRRGKQMAQASAADTLAQEEAYAEESGAYTARLVRFHSPTIGVYVSSPYYVDYCDIWWYDPWLYSPWYGWGWRPYAWGGWWGGWYDPWYGWGPAWGWHPGPSWGWRPAYAYRGPGNRYNGSHRGGGVGTSRPSSRYFSSTGGTRYAGTTRSSASRYSSSSRPSSSRTFGNAATRLSSGVSTNSSSTRTSRGQVSGTSRPSSTSTPSRSFGNSSGSRYSSPSRSGSSRPSGTGRSFGGGGGSRGGRR